MANPAPHPANAPGDFYVVDGCCTMCEVPFIEAPGLFGTTHDPKGYLHCYVRRQPETPAELDQMVSAIRCAESQCIRYRGSDRVVRLRLVGDGEGVVCDGLSTDSGPSAVRDAGGRSPARPWPWWKFW